jgi:KUP system potassium uptake protein
MLTTSFLFFLVMRRWQWPLPYALALFLLFLAIDLSFFAANSMMFLHGGWIVMCFAVTIFIVMLTWNRVRRIIDALTVESKLPINLFIEGLAKREIPRVAGVAVFMSAAPTGVPLVLLHHFKHNKVLHETVLILAIITERIPKVEGKDRLEIQDLGQGFYHVKAHYGYSEVPEVPGIIRAFAAKTGKEINPMEVSYYFGRRSLTLTDKPTMPRWQKLLFSFLLRNSSSAASFFGLPPNRVIELGAHIEL